MRVNTGRWGTSKDFDALMANRGIEPPLPGYKDEDGFPWVIECFEKCLPTAEKCGVVLGLENHWGLARTPEGLLRIHKAVNSPWLGVTFDMGNFLEDPYTKLEQIAPAATHVHAKTYYGGGVWYTLDLDYDRIVGILRKVNYRGRISLEFEGKEIPRRPCPRAWPCCERRFGRGRWSSTTMNQEAYDIGYDAYWEGAETTDNPYDPEEDAEAFRSWEDGWRKARVHDYDETTGDLNLFPHRPIRPQTFTVFQQPSVERMPAERGAVANHEQFPPGAGHGDVHAADVATGSRSRPSDCSAPAR